MSSQSTPAVKRHHLLLERLRDEGILKISALPKEMGVTSMTIWRDIKLLEEQGLLERRRGAILAVKRFDGEMNFEQKHREAVKIKKSIARLAVQTYVKAGDQLAIEGGTTVASFAAELPDSKVSVTTNSLPIALQLRKQKPLLPLQVIGGWLSNISGNTTGPEALRKIEKMHFSKCFLSATGWDAEKGPMDPTPLEIEVKRAMAARSDQVILLVHSEKFFRTSSSVMIHPRRMDAVITEQPPPEAIKKQLSSHGVVIHLSRPES